ncbi:UDP-glucose 4-epimerase [Jannaschia seosinensis]|uniref:UDP-glucose 4-epimerase n=1 Tax=Jannaschia seosinensis TaxID=313367 RepID=A0A0M7B7G5_9RHOB|nr:NAD-dependent epimerase/dehydratase family protein [Jannaschia seosinensis]CUH23292.1 UDP-glucose 4-epimerase [Jannaschia seosinensis]
MTAIFVTGASGILGYALAGDLARRGRDVTAITRSPLPGPVPGGLRRILTADPLIPDWVAAQDATIVHFAGLSRVAHGFADWDTLERSEIAPQVGMLDGLATRGWRGHMVYVSSAAVYAPDARLPIAEDAPLAAETEYGRQKIALEAAHAEAAAAEGRALTILRVANPYGMTAGRDRGVIPLVIDAAQRGTRFTVNGTGREMRDYLHVDDLCAAFRATIDRPPEAGSPRILNLGSGTGTTLPEIIALVEAAVGRAVDYRFAPADVGSSVLSIDRINTVLGWAPRIPLDEGIARLAGAR